MFDTLTLAAAALWASGALFGAVAATITQLVRERRRRRPTFVTLPPRPRA